MRLKEFWATFCPSIYLSIPRIYQSSKIRWKFSFTGAAASIYIFIWLGQLGSRFGSFCASLFSSSSCCVAMMKGFNLGNSHNSGFLMTKASFDENALVHTYCTVFGTITEPGLPSPILPQEISRPGYTPFFHPFRPPSSQSQQQRQHTVAAVGKSNKLVITISWF